MKIKIINKSSNKLPFYAHPGDAGFDLMSNEDEWISSGETKIIGTGLFVEIPEGYEMQIRSRSGMSIKGLVIKNSPGTIDQGYRNEIKLICYNVNILDDFDKENSEDAGRIKINIGDRIAQGVICPVIRAEFEEVKELSDSERNLGGLGSTGVK
jgi:dUTP pyrophosphatase